MIENKFLSDIAKFSNNTLNVMTGAQRQIRQIVAEQIENLTSAMELVSRKELDVYKEIAQKALVKIEDLEKRLSAFEAGNTPKKAKAKTSEKA